MSKTIKLNSDGTINDYTYVLSKTNHEHLGQLKNITDAFCKSNMNSIDEISFKIYKELDGKIEPLWNELSDLRLIYVAEIDEYFQIEAPISDTNNNICKSITATSQCEAELSQTLVSIEINSEDDIARTNYYEEFPTVFYRDINDLNKYENIWNSSDKFTIYKDDKKTVVDLDATLELRRSILKGSSLMHRVLYKNPNYSIGHIDDSLKGLIRTFSVSDTALYDFLSGDVSEQYNCLFQYDSVNRTISAYDLYTVCNDCGYRGDFNDICPKCGSTELRYYGEDTTIFISSDNLTEEISYSTDVDSIKNTFKLEAGDDLMTAQVVNCNPTGEYLIYVAPELRDDMSDELVLKLDSYSELVQKNEAIYQQYVSNWEEALEQVNYLTHTMMPSVSDIESGTATVSAATEIAKITESNLSPMAVSKLATSTSVYTISSALENYVKVFVKTGYVHVTTFDSSFVYVGEKSDGFIHGTWKGKFRVSNYSVEDDVLETGEITIDIYDNYEEFINQKIVKTIAVNADADHSVFDVLSLKDLQEFKDALKLYCRERLKSFHDAIYAACSALQSINQSNTEAELYEDVYKPYIDKVNACADEMDIREQEISEQQSIADDNLNKMNEIRDFLNFESFLGEELYKEFCSFRREDKYSNTNYISDGLTTSQQIENAKKFLEQAKKSIVKFGTPTHKIFTTLYNLLLIPEFKPIINKFQLGNWLRIKVDDVIYRLRLISYEINFENISTINVEFSDVTKTSDGYSDIQSILSSAASISSSISMVSKQAEKGEKANNEIINAVENGLNSALITIKNNKNEEFVVDENGIMGRSFDDTTGEYSPKQIAITHNILAFTTDNWTTTSLAIGEHEYNYYNSSKGSMDVGIDYGVTAKFVQAGYIWGTSIVSGNIYSSNYKYGSTGTHFDLKSGSFELAGDKIVYDSTKNKLQLKGVNIEWASSTTPKITDIDGLSKDLEEKSASIAANANAITAEITRATTAESNLSSAITQTAESITSTVASTYETKNNAKTNYTSLQSQITQNADNIELKVEKDSIISTINQSAEKVSIQASKISLEGLVTANSYFKINADGSMETTNGTFSGKITATTGSVGNWTIGRPPSYSLNECLYTLTDFGIIGLQSSSASSNVAFFVKDTTGNDITYIKNNGELYTQNINATGGQIAGFNINNSSIYNGTNSLLSNTKGIYIGTDGIRQYASSAAYVNISNGVLEAKGAIIDGKITGDNIEIHSINSFKSTSTASIKTQDFYGVEEDDHYQLLELDSIYINSLNEEYRRTLSCDHPGYGISIGCYIKKSDSSDIAWYTTSNISCREEGDIKIFAKYDISMKAEGIIEIESNHINISGDLITYNIIPYKNNEEINVSTYNLGSSYSLWNEIHAMNYYENGILLSNKYFNNSKIAYGTIVITPSAANTPTSSHVNFSDYNKTFSKEPIVIVGLKTAVPGTVVTGCSANEISKTGFDVCVTRKDTINTRLYWIAIE